MSSKTAAKSPTAKKTEANKAGQKPPIRQSTQTNNKKGNQQQKAPANAKTARVPQGKPARSSAGKATVQARPQPGQEARVRTIGILIAVLVVVGGGALAFLVREALKPKPPGEEVPLMRSYHLASGDEKHDPYTTDPPTSGPHVGQLPKWDVYTMPITKELQIHALEDAGVVINYRPDLDKATVDRLAGLTHAYTSQITRASQDNHVMMSPYPGLSDPIVLTAWRHIARFKQFDEAGIVSFINAYKNIDHHADSAEGQTPTPGP